MRYVRQVVGSGRSFSRWLLLAAIALVAVMAFGVGSPAASPGVLDHFDVLPSVSTSAAGDALDVTVTAKDDTGATVGGYLGTVHFSSSDTNASTVLPADYTFVSGDNGSKVFTGGVTLTTAGSQTVSVTDTADATKTGISDGIVVTPAAVDHFVFGAVTPAAKAGVPSSVGVSAFDQYGNASTDGLSPAALTHTLHGSSVGCAGPCVVSAALGAFDSNGVATATFTAYKAESGRTLTVTAQDGAASTSGSFAVAPAPVDHFEFGLPSPAAKAGVQSTVSVSAFDQYENPSTDSLGSPLLSSTLHGSSVGCGVGNASACVEAESLSAFGSGATATITFKAYQAETGRTLTVTAGNSKASTSAPFEVLPAALDHFVWTTQPPSQPTAGFAFGAAVTAYDRYGNIKTNYNPGTADVTRAGLHNSPNPPVIFGAHAGNQPPSYGTLSWTGGVGTMSGIIDKDAEATKLTIANVTITSDTPSVSADSDLFTVAPASPDALAFTQQPLETQVNSVINGATTPPGVRVQAIDPYANLASNTSVTIAIGSNPGGGALSGTTPKLTNSSGIAIFDDLKISQVGIGYTLVASAPPATKTSNAFIIAQTVAACSSTCSGTATVPQNTTLSVSATGTTGTNTLGIALAAATIPAGACPGFQEAPGVVSGHVDVSYLNFTTTGANPTLQLVWRLDKSIVLKIPNNSTSAYDVCLGSVNLLDLQGTHTTGFPTKSGQPATPIFDPVFGVTAYWGVLPNCTQKTKTPCVFSRVRSSGDEVVTFNVQYPWDPTPHLG